MTDSYLYLLVKALLTLLFVLGIMGVSLYAFKFMAGKGANRGKAANPVRLLSTFLLGQKRSLSIVEVAGEVLVLGITPASITLITKVEGAEAAEELKKLGEGKGRSLLSLFQSGM